MKHLSNILYQTALNFIKYLSLLIGMLLFISGFLFTAYAEDMTSQEMLLRIDNPLFGLLGLILFAGFLYLICRLGNRAVEKCKKILLFLAFSWYLVFGLILILFSKTVPAADSMSVYSAAAELAAGNMEVIHPTASYLSYYPQQIGLVAYYEVVIRLWNLLPVSLHAYHFIKCLNLFWVGCILFFQYKSVQLLFKSHITEILYLLLVILHLPLLIYTSFVYGEIPSFALFSAGAWALLRLLYDQPEQQRGSQKCSRTLLLALFSCLSFCLSVALRKNTLILMIAVFIVTLLEAFFRGSKKLLIQGIVYIGLSVMILPCIQSVYELRADNTLLTGVPAMSYFAMGMQEGGRGAGWYNGFNFNTYQATGMDTALTNQLSRKSIVHSLSRFQAEPLYACRFYGNKFITQWADGTYASLQATLATFGGRQRFFQELYEGSYSGYFRNYCNALQNVIYLGALLFAAGAFKKKTSTRGESSTLQGLPVYLFMIGVIGGLLFHMIWEANSRYIFPYGILLLPYAAGGLRYIITPSPQTQAD